MTKQFWGIIAAVVIVLGGIFFITNHSSAPGSSASPTHHVHGSTQYGITLVEYGDYQCPACASYEPTVEQAYAKYKDEVQFQFRNLPLTSLHPNAFAGARAAEAAALQNKFWEMHDLLYQENEQYVASNGTLKTWINSSSPSSYFTKYAQQLGLNVDQFKKDYASSKVNNAINADLAAFKATGKDEATPTFFLNGKQVSMADPKTGQPSLDQFSKVLDAAIAAKKPAATPASNSSNSSTSNL